MKIYTMDDFRNFIKDSKFYKSHGNGFTINPAIKHCRISLIDGDYFEINLPPSHSSNDNFSIKYYTNTYNNTHKIIINNLNNDSITFLITDKKFHNALLSFWYFINSKYLITNCFVYYNVSTSKLTYYKQIKLTKEIK